MSDFIFDKVYREYRDMIYNYIRVLVYDRQIAEDLTQEVFIRVFKSLGRFKGQSSLRVWLFKIAKNTAYTWMKKHLPIREAETDIDSEKIAETEKDVDKKLMIQQAFEKLEHRDKTLIILRDHYAFSYREMADILELNEGRVKIGLHRARKAFRLIYERMMQS